MKKTKRNKSKKSTVSKNEIVISKPMTKTKFIYEKVMGLIVSPSIFPGLAIALVRKLQKKENNFDSLVDGLLDFNLPDNLKEKKDSSKIKEKSDNIEPFSELKKKDEPEQTQETYTKEQTKRMGKILVRNALFKGKELAKEDINYGFKKLVPINTIEQNGKQVKVYSRNQIQSLLFGEEEINDEEVGLNEETDLQQERKEEETKV